MPDSSTGPKHRRRSGSPSPTGSGAPDAADAGTNGAEAAVSGAGAASHSLDRRRFVTYMIAGPTLVIGGAWVLDNAAGQHAEAQLSPTPGPTESDFHDLGDQLTFAALPTMALLTLEVTEEGRAVFELPRSDNGQGIATTAAMMIADELGFPLENVDVTLKDSTPELMFNQLTGGSYNVRALYEPVRKMAAAAREGLLSASSERSGVPLEELDIQDGEIVSQDGAQESAGQLTQEAARQSRPMDPPGKPVSEQTVLGERRPVVDARDIVTGRKTFANDLRIDGAKPAVSVHSPDLLGTLASFDNEDEIRDMPGVIDVTTIRAVPVFGFSHDPVPLAADERTAIIILAETYGQALDAEEAVQATWNPGPVADMSDADFRNAIESEPHPLTAPEIGAQTVDMEIYLNHVAHAPLETQSAVADVRDGEAEIWSALKIPIPAQREISEVLGLTLDAVTVHVMPGGGSFGRRLFHEGALEAALASSAFGQPVNLQWSREQDTQHSRYRPPSLHKMRATILAGDVQSFEHRYTSGATGFSHGVGDALTSVGAHQPQVTNLVANDIHRLQLTSPYNFGLITNTLVEVDFGMTPHTGSWRAVYGGTGRTVEEIMIDKVAAELGRDPVEFRRETAKEDALVRCIDWVAENGDWGRDMPSGTAQGFASNSEGRSSVACLVELDSNGDAPRVTKAVMAFDAGIPLNPNGLEGQMLGGLNDGIATMLQAGIHFDDGQVRESSYSDYQFTLQGNTPPEVIMHVFPAQSDDALIGGAGEFTVAPGGAAVVNALDRATGTEHRSFPINF